MFRRAVKRTKVHQRETGQAGEDDVISKETLGAVESNDEAALELLVLGGEAMVLDRLRQPTSPSRSHSQSNALRPVKRRKSRREETAPAWEDDEDINRDTQTATGTPGKGSHSTITKKRDRLKQRYTTAVDTPAWARLHKEDLSEEDSDTEGLVQATGDFLATSEALPGSSLDIKRCADANKDSPAKSKLTCVEFHPSSQVILTAGTNNTLSLFQVDGKHNPKIQSVFLDNFPLYSAHFTADGEQVVLASKHKSFYYYDMMAGKVVNVPQIKGLEENSMKRFEVSPDGRFLVFLGKHGHLHLLSAKSKEWIHSLKMNGSAESVAFSNDGQTMFSFGDDSEVYVWDLGTRDCVHRFTDEGCVRGTSLVLSPSGRHLACGSQSGVVNVYDRDHCLRSRHPQPLKAFMNLTTSCTAARFNSTSEVLALASSFTERAIKMVHFPSLTVFSNFPSRTESGLRIPICMDFSPHSGYFCVGTHKGTALLYRLKHYGNY